MTKKAPAKAAQTRAPASAATTHRADHALAYVRGFLSHHGIAAETFTAENAAALLEAIDSAK